MAFNQTLQFNEKDKLEQGNRLKNPVEHQQQLVWWEQTKKTWRHLIRTRLQAQPHEPSLTHQNHLGCQTVTVNVWSPFQAMAVSCQTKRPFMSHFGETCAGLFSESKFVNVLMRLWRLHLSSLRSRSVKVQQLHRRWNHCGPAHSARDHWCRGGARVPEDVGHGGCERGLQAPRTLAVRKDTFTIL